MRKLLIACLLFYSHFLTAQKAFEGIKVDTSEVKPKKFDIEAIEAYKAQPQFEYREMLLEMDVEPSRIERFLNWLNRNVLKLLEWIFGVEHASGIFSFVLQALPYAIGLLVIYLILKFFVERNTTDFISNAKNQRFNSGSEEEELIRNTDLDKLLNESIAAKNYRAAIRYYYLLLLKKLDDTQLILWEQQKTNEDFIKEIASDKIRQAFEENTRWYDFIWYGDFNLSQDDFLRAEIDFKTTDNLIKNNKP